MKKAIVIGGGPAGLMAAEQLLEAGFPVHLYDAMPTVGRKFLLAGVGGMNITHSEPFNVFVERYADRQSVLQPVLKNFGPTQLVEWIHRLGIETFVGSSGRVFPKQMKAAPLLRAWLSRLKKQGLALHTRHRWLGWDESGRLLFEQKSAEQGNSRTTERAEVVVVALGGGSWPKLGSDGKWQQWMNLEGVSIEPLKPANCGFIRQWSHHLVKHFAGEPIKNIAASVTDLTGQIYTQRGECLLTEQGMEGGLMYALSRILRECIEKNGAATLSIDLCPDRSLENLATGLSQSARQTSLSHVLKNKFKLSGAKRSLLFEVLSKEQWTDRLVVAQTIKALPIEFSATCGLEKAISSAGGIRFKSLTEQLMLKSKPGVFCAGEMLDWDAPTGGYLLTACFATGQHAGKGAVNFLNSIDNEI